METTKKPRRRRRTKAEIESTLWAALEKLIVKKGIKNITLTGLACEAEVEPVVIYNRFRDISDVIEKYIRRYDYWLSDIVKINTADNPKDNLKRILVNQINELYQNKVMQQILQWELANETEVTRRMAATREIHAKPLYLYFNEQLEAACTGLEPVTSVLIAGIYYLILHRKVSTFGEIDFDSLAGKKILIETVEELIDKSFMLKSVAVPHKKPQTVVQVAENLLEAGTNKKVIARATGLSMKEINSLAPKRKKKSK